MQHRSHHRRGRHAAPRRGVTGRYTAVVAVVLAAVAGVPLLFDDPGSPHNPATAAASAGSAPGAENRIAEAERRASRSEPRTPDTPGTPSRSALPTLTPTPKKSSATAAPPPSPPPASTTTPSVTPSAPAGAIEMANAATIVEAGQQLGLPSSAYVVAVAAALQECDLHNLANAAVPESLDLPNEGLATDGAGLGLFQQDTDRGTVAQLMDPAAAAGLFYAALAQVDGWEQLPVGAAAQAVQGAASPDGYAARQDLAERIVAAATP
ncbi:peptidase M23 [Dactylosporangium sp. CS-047395]|uniref:peptidase M23 n=1 Tax=Dactylosporangium sp. CS-047395 TaxID=3239936 RepID=UPI003D936DBA